MLHYSMTEIFDQETIDRLPVAEVRRIARVMEIMAKFNVGIQTVVQSLEALQPTTTWTYRDGTAFDAVLERYNKLAEGDGYQWTPPSERK